MEDQPGPGAQGNAEYLTSRRLIGLQGRLARPFWGILGGWAAWCGVLASKQLRWDGQVLLTCALVLVLADLAWGSLWDLVTGTDWFGLVSAARFPPSPAQASGLPYTLPSSPGGRLSLGLSRLVGWWRQVFWPAAGAVVLGLAAATVLTVILCLLLPDRLRPLNAAVVALIGVGLFQRKRGRDPLAGQSLVQVGLSWLAGHLAFAGMEKVSLALALMFAIAAWGATRVGQGHRGGLWFLNGGLAASAVLMVVLKQHLAAGVMGLLVFGPVALQVVFRSGDELASKNLRDRTGPWLMAIMLVAALAVP